MVNAKPTTATLWNEWYKLLREGLPCAVWTLADGSEVLLSRDYEPRWFRKPGEKATRVDDPSWRADLKAGMALSELASNARDLGLLAERTSPTDSVATCSGCRRVRTLDDARLCEGRAP